MENKVYGDSFGKFEVRGDSKDVFINHRDTVLVLYLTGERKGKFYYKIKSKIKTKEKQND